MLQAALSRLASGARVVLSVAVSQYNAAEVPRGPANYMQLLGARASIAGFVIFDYADRYANLVLALESETARAGRRLRETGSGSRRTAARPRLLWDGPRPGSFGE